MAAIDNGAKLRAAALAAIDRQCFGEDFGFDSALVVAQGPTGGAMVVYQLVVTKKNPLLGQGPLVNVTQIASPDPTAEQVEKAITEAMKGLRELSTKILSEGSHQAPGTVRP